MFLYCLVNILPPFYRFCEFVSCWVFMGHAAWCNKDGWIAMIIITRALRECKPPSTPKFQPKVIRDSNLDFVINPYLDPDVRRICPKMLRMHYLVGVSHFAKYSTNRPLIVWEMLTHVPSITIPGPSLLIPPPSYGWRRLLCSHRVPISWCSMPTSAFFREYWIDFDEYCGK